MGSRRARAQGVLPEPVSARQAVPGPQDAVLRRGPVLILRHDRVRRADEQARGGWVLQQGEVVQRGLQPGVHLDAAAVPAQGLRVVPDRHVVRDFPAGR